MKPINYNLTFEPNFKDFTFNGTAIITTEGEGTITLHSAELDIKEVIINDQKAEFSLNKKEETLTITNTETNPTIKITFIGTLNERLAGFYRSQYKEGNQTKYLATTQFEAADARRAFPCWDEPKAKATFEITVITDKHLEAISNMPVKEKKKDGNKTTFTFDTTPIMSTYLIYLGVGEFERITEQHNKKTISVITTKGKKEQGKVALDYTIKVLDLFEKYFDIPFPLPKVDMLAIPDFASGAMENWGAITFRESMLLYDEKNSSLSTKQVIAEVIAHELAHQWFGNLVTMEWWNDLWLNESFATFMAHKAVNMLHPEWDIWEDFLKSTTTAALALDALQNSHPINVDVNHPSEIREIFDQISYDKGGSVLNMLEDFIGKDAFQKGLHNYLKKHQYKNAQTIDLWTALADASEKPVQEMMDTWVQQMGYPLITFNEGRITQEQFLLNGDKGEGKWIIPITYTDGNEHKLLMEDETADIEINGWAKLNHNQKGFYRVAYPKEIQKTLKQKAADKTLSHIDRWGIQDDFFATTLAGKTSFKDYLDFVQDYAHDDDNLPAGDVTANLHLAHTILAPEHEDILKDFNKEYFATLFKRIGWNKKEGEKHTDTLLRSTLISGLGKYGDELVIQEAQKRFDGDIDPDIRGAVYAVVAWTGNKDTHNRLIELYSNATSDEEKVRVLVALSNFNDKSLLTKTLEFALTDAVRSQNFFIPLVVAANNPTGKMLTWKWTKDNWDAIIKKVGVGNFLMNRIAGIPATIPDRDVAKDYKAFFDKHPVPGTERKISQTLEKMEIYARFVERVTKEFA